MESQRHIPGALLDVTIRSLQESELDIADRIFRVAFGTFIGLLKSGFRTDMYGIAMQRPNEVGYNRPDVYLISDWR